MKSILLFLFTIFLILSSYCQEKSKASLKIENNINLMLDNWHLAAANANDSIYFGSLAENAIYIGTDANELWTKQEFYNFAKKYFEREKAWDFKPIERNIYFNLDTSIAWFDEKLDTWMGICRASGVLEKKELNWKIVHYQLSMTIPNEKVQDVIRIIEPNTK